MIISYKLINFFSIHTRVPNTDRSVIARKVSPALIPSSFILGITGSLMERRTLALYLIIDIQEFRETLPVSGHIGGKDLKLSLLHTDPGEKPEPDR